MLRFLRDYLLVVCIILAAVATVAITLGCTKEQDRHEFKAGKLAYETGVPANANPWMGWGNGSAERWLDGWMHAKRLQDRKATEK